MACPQNGYVNQGYERVTGTGINHSDFQLHISLGSSTCLFSKNQEGQDSICNNCNEKLSPYSRQMGNAFRLGCVTLSRHYMHFVFCVVII